MKVNLCIIPLYHSDYPYEVGNRFAQKLSKKMEERGVKVWMSEGVNETSEIRPLIGKIIVFRPDIIVLFVSTWIEAPKALDLVLNLPNIPIVVWGLRMYYKDGKRESTGSLPGAAVLKASLESLGYKIKFIIGMPDEEKTIEELYDYCTVAYTIMKLRESKIGLIGYASMGMYPATFDPLSMRRKFKLNIIHIDSSSIFNVYDDIGRVEAESIINVWRKRYFIERDVENKDLLIASKIYLSLKHFIEKYSLNGLTIKCQYEFSKEFGFVPCIPLSILADEGIVCSCEGDVPLTVTMLILHYLTTQPIYYGDIVDIRSNRIYLSSCGFAPLKLASSKNMGIGLHKFFFRGLRSGITLKEGKVTLARLGWINGEYRLHVALGEIIKSRLRQDLFPAAEIEIYGDIRNFIKNILSQHYALAYGDFTNHLKEICRFLELKYVLT